MRHISEVLSGLFDPSGRIPVDDAKTNPLARVGSRFVGVPTGFSDIDQLIGGLRSPDLTVIASRSSMGKTSLSLGMAYGAAVGHAKAVGFFSLETKSDQLVSRLLAMETGVDSHRLRLGQIDDNEWDRISRAFGRVSEAPIFIDDSATNIAAIRTEARRLQRAHGLDLIIIDCLQLVDDEDGIDRVVVISQASRALKALARELDVPVVVLSQVSWDVESRPNHRPLLTDLGEAGSLVSDADVIMFIYREEKYEADSEKRGVAEIIVAKHPEGRLGVVNLRFFERTARFADLELYTTAGV